jgi:hypothetical protein
MPDNSIVGQLLAEYQAAACAIGYTDSEWRSTCILPFSYLFVEGIDEREKTINWNGDGDWSDDGVAPAGRCRCDG